MSMLRWMVAGGGLAMLSATAGAAEFVITDPYYYLDNRSVSNTGLNNGLRGVLGASAVVPSSGTSGVASNSGYLNGATVPLFFQAQIVGSNEFAATVPATAAPIAPWTLMFINGTTTHTAITPDIAGAQLMGFARNVAIGGTATSPNFNWLGAAGQGYDAVRLNFYNLDQRVSGLATLFQTVNLSSASASSYTVPASWNLAMGTHYSVEISLIDTRDGTGNLNQSNLLSRSRSFFDFSLISTSIAGPIYLPTVTPATANSPYIFSFNVSGVSSNATTFIDPDIALGYDYSIGAGDPNFSAVQLPSIGDGLFDLYLWNGSAWTFSSVVQAGQLYAFGGSGVSKFRILGIEASAALNPTDGTAFITGLRFTGAGDFTGTMTPITAVPEPTALALWAAGLAGLLWRRRSRSSAPA